MTTSTQPIAHHLTLLGLAAALALLSACGGGVGSSLGLGDREVTSDPDALLAAQVAGNATAGMESALAGVGLLTEIPLGQLPDEAVQIASSALNELFSSCLAVTPITGESTGLTIAFAQDGCGLPKTNLALRGAFSFETGSSEAGDRWAMRFEQFLIAGIGVSGGLEAQILQGEKLDYNIDALQVDYGSDPIAVDAIGSLTTNGAHTDILFTGQGAVTFSGDTYAMEITDLDRHFTSDCFPEAGTVSVSFPGATGQTTATIAFDDSNLGLDSDDSGLVYVRLNGAEHVAELPSRLCSGF